MYEKRYTALEMGSEFTLGFVCGEWLADDHDNIYYFSGWLASGFFVLGDLRDIAATLSRGDLIGTGLNLAGLIPGAGDAIKSSTIAIAFVSKHPEMVAIICKSFNIGDEASIAKTITLPKNIDLARGFKHYRESELYLESIVSGQKQCRMVLENGDVRIVDVFGDDKVLHEMKMGRTYNTKLIKEQISKDLQLLEERGDVEGIEWHFTRSALTGKIGPSGPLMKYIEDINENGIKIIVTIHDKN